MKGIPAGTMAASERKRVVDGPGAFHPKCSANVKLSNERRVASGKTSPAFTFSKDQIPTGLQFSVKILQQSFVYVSPMSASSRLHTSDAPYIAGGAVHVVHCCLFFV